MLRGRTPSSLQERLLDPAGLGLGRAAAGVSMVTRPGLLAGAMGVDPQTAARTSWVVQMLGAREIAVGLGSVVGLRGDRRTRRTWLSAGLLCDAVDAVALAAAVKGKRVGALPGAAVVAIATTAVVIQARPLLRD